VTNRIWLLPKLKSRQTLRPILTVALQHELEGQIPHVQVRAETPSLRFAATYHINCLFSV
jgi:hypothetical protein